MMSRDRQIMFLKAVIRTGSVKAGAHELGLSVNHVKNELSELYLRLGVHSIHEAAYRLWLQGLWRDPA